MLVLSCTTPLIAQHVSAQLDVQAATQGDAADSPSLQLVPESSTDGQVLLSWRLPDASAAGVLQQATTPDFSTALSIPVSPAGSLTQSGLADGLYYFRAGSDGRWSPVREMRVAHHPLSQALLWFALGLLLFGVLLGVILHGSLRRGGRHE